MSKGAGDGRVVSKARVTCAGTYPSVQVRMELWLLKGPTVGPKQVMAYSDQTQTVADNGRPATYYVPTPNGNQVRGAGWYTGQFDAEIVSPQPGNIGRGNSRTVHLS